MAKKAKVITKTACRRLMKVEADASIVAADAVAALMDYLQDTAVTITQKALELTKHAKRKTISKADIKIALQSL
ncbi:MAG: NFYB/HAP3 family transcription factor subunit [Candidatus Helarchaeota archaeon]|nr:NFYB/HAP3 family transcription factor subunit [Candidatus Helarchaeota archaeon]